MSNPVPAATPDTTKVSEVVKLITTDEEGNYVFPENVELDETLKFAATSEKRRRDTQAEFTRVNQAKMALEAENNLLRENLLKTGSRLTDEQKTELEDLKMTDPDSWRLKLNEYESQALESQKTKIDTMVSEVKSTASKQFVETQRSETLKEFNKENNINLTDELLLDEVPNRIHKKLAEGKISYEEYLEESLKFLTTSKAIYQEPVVGDPNLSNVSGGKTPGKIEDPVSLKELYKKDLY